MSHPTHRRALVHRLVFSMLSVLFLAPTFAAAQTVDISGFVKTSFYYDSRQIVAAREGDFVLYPQPEVLVDGEDQNETDNLLIFPLFSRLAFSVGDLPDVKGATVTGHVEGDFHGASNALINSFRLRRGFVKFAWERHEALFGMEWSPTFLETWPRTAATEAGVPYHCFSRLPQARYTFKPDGFTLKLLVAQERDAFAELSGLKSAQQAGLPMLMAFASIDRESFQIGGGTWTKWVRPTLTAERFQAMAFQGFMTLSPGPVTFRTKVTYGEDLADQIMTGGYLLEDDGDAVTLQTLAGWAEIETTNAEGLNYGLFGGYFTNLGAGETVNEGNPVDSSQVFARGANIESGFRIAPRVTYTEGKVRFAFELQVDDATYAAELDEEYAPSGDTNSVMNVRGDFSVYLFF